MARFTKDQASFISGRLSPRLYGRIDLESYQKGAKEIKNLVVTPQGGVTRRPGTEYIKQSKHPQSTSTRKSRLIPFIFSNEEAYCVSINGWESGQTTFGAITPGGTTGTPAGIEIINVNSKRTIHLSDSLVNGTSFFNTSFYGNGGTTEAVFTPSPSELDEIQYAQNGGVLILVHPKFNPVLIIRTGPDIFKLRHYQPNDTVFNIPFNDMNTDSTRTMTMVNAAGNDRSLVTNFDFFHPGHVGAMIRFDDPAGLADGCVYVKTIINPRSAIVNIILTIPAAIVGPPTAGWTESAWSDFAGWPRTVCFYDQRLFFGGNEANPNTLWASRQNNFEEKNQEVLPQVRTANNDIDAFSVTLDSATTDSIQWMAPGKTLIVGTGVNEYVISSSDATGAISKVNRIATVETSHGSELVRPVRIGNSVIFVSKGWEKIREFTFNLDEDRYRAEYLNILADDISRVSQENHETFNSARIKQLSYQESRNQVIWAIDDNGGLFGCTRDRVNSVNAWHTHQIGGYGNSSQEATYVESLCTIPSENGDFDDIWICVRRYVNGATFYSIERMLQDYELPSIANDSDDIRDKPVYSDAASYQKQSTPGTVFGGLEHLVGETVVVVADSQLNASEVVSAGSQYITNTNAESDTSGWTHFTDVNTLVNGVDVVTNEFALIGHTFREGQRITYSSSGAAPGGLISGNPYFIRNPTATRFQLSEEADFPIIDLTTNPGVTHTFTPRFDASNGNTAAGPLTFVRNTATPIAGVGSFELQKDAVDRRGAGISSAFTINTQDKGKRLRVSFVYSFSGSADKTMLGVSIYDVTNNTLINPEYFKHSDAVNNPNIYDRLTKAANLANNGNGSSSFECDFIASETSTSYRLIIMIISTSAVAGSFFFDTFSVTGTGYITLDDSATEVIAGLGYDSILRSLDLEAGSDIGASQGSHKRINEIRIRLNKTIGGKFGRDADNLVPINYETQNMVASDPRELFSGDKIYEFRGDNDRSAEFYIKQDLPLPIQVLSFIARGQTND